MTRVYRIQDDEGRGPWRPGFSLKWLDASTRRLPPALFEEFGRDVIARRALPGEYIYCGVRKISDLIRWITMTEQLRLVNYGYHLVSVRADRIIAESTNQLVFVSRTRLGFGMDTTILPWDLVYNSRNTNQTEIEKPT